MLRIVGSQDPQPVWISTEKKSLSSIRKSQSPNNIKTKSILRMVNLPFLLVSFLSY
jgi:hypothetical protein